MDRERMSFFAGRFNIFSRSFWEAPANVLCLSAGLGTFLVALHLVFGFELYNDVAGCYAPMAAAVGRGDWSGGLLAWLPPLLPGMAGFLCMAGAGAVGAVAAVSGFFYVACIAPLYSLLRFFLPGREAAWGCLLYILAPKMIRFGCSGLLESGRNFFAIAVLALLLWGWKNWRWWNPLLLGVSLGGLAMARSEGIAFAVPAFAIMLFAGTLKIGSWKDALKLLCSLSIALAALCAVIAPRSLQIYWETGYLAPDVRMLELFTTHPGAASTRPLEAPAVRFIPPPQSAATENADVSKSPAAVPAPAAAAAAPPQAAAPEPMGYVERICQESFDSMPTVVRHVGIRTLENGGKALFDFIRGSYELYLVLAAIGLVSIVRNGVWRVEYLVILLFAGVNFACVLPVGSAFRYFTLNVLLFMPFTVAGLLAVCSLLARAGLRKFVPAILALFAVLQAANGLENLGCLTGSYPKVTGLWLHQHRKELKAPGDDGKLVILARRPQYAFWSGGRHLPFDKHKELDASRIGTLVFDVAVFEKDEDCVMDDLLRRRPELRLLDQRLSGDCKILIRESSLSELRRLNIVACP